MATATQHIGVFVEKLLDEKGLGKYRNEDPTLFEQLKKDLMSRVEDIINAMILQKLPPEKLKDFEHLLDMGGDEVTVQKFCSLNIPDIEESLAATMLSFRNRYLGALSS